MRFKILQKAKNYVVSIVDKLIVGENVQQKDRPSVEMLEMVRVALSKTCKTVHQVKGSGILVGEISNEQKVCVEVNSKNNTVLLHSSEKQFAQQVDLAQYEKFLGKINARLGFEKILYLENPVPSTAVVAAFSYANSHIGADAVRNVVVHFIRTTEALFGSLNSATESTNFSYISDAILKVHKMPRLTEREMDAELSKVIACMQKRGGEFTMDKNSFSINSSLDLISEKAALVISPEADSSMMGIKCVLELRFENEEVGLSLARYLNGCVLAGAFVFDMALQKIYYKYAVPCKNSKVSILLYNTVINRCRDIMMQNCKRIAAVAHGEITLDNYFDGE